jgi:hypothetical protein
MTSDRTTARPAFSDPDDYRHMKDVLEAAGYQDKTILEALRIGDFPSLRGQDQPILLERTSGGSPLDTLIRLFLLEKSVDRETMKQAIRPMTVEAWVKAGILEHEGDSLRAGVKLLPFHEMLVAFDPDRTVGAGDYVMGIGSSSLTLANITVRRQGSRTFDLGTGCGIQALLAAPHSDSVAASDRNSRAVAVARFNARLNGLDHITCLEGDLFGPVDGLRFDLIVSNPPFVISPDTRYVYRDSGMEDDRICQAIVRTAPDFLVEGGYCQILCNWAEYRGQDWRNRLATWFEGTGCDVWVMRSESRQAEMYASTWIRHTERLDDTAFARRFDEWMAYYRKREIESVAAGIITMRRKSSGPNWVRIEEGPEKMIGPCGESVLRGFEAMDFLQAMGDDSGILGACFHVSPDVRLNQQYEPVDGAWSVVESSVRLSKGLAYDGQTDPVVANLLAVCDGRSTLNEIINRIALQLGSDPGGITNQFVELARRLVERGFIVPEKVAT